MRASDYFVGGEELIEMRKERGGPKREKVRRSQSPMAGIAKVSVNAEPRKQRDKCTEQYCGYQESRIGYRNPMFEIHWTR